MPAGCVYVAGTCDTKGPELRYVRDLIAAQGLLTRLVDLSTGGGGGLCDISPAEVASHHPGGVRAVQGHDRGPAVNAMMAAFEAFIAAQGDVAGLIGLGGSGGTTMVTAGMRALPIGVPKLMVSTVASSNVAAYVGPSDITMMYSVTDIAGLNRLSRTILGNAAHAMAGMVRHALPLSTSGKQAVGLTMFGVTTACITQLVGLLDDQFDCLVFHATGTGGQSMEKLAQSGLVRGLLDITTTEVCDLLIGGVFACTEQRFDAVAQTRLPYVGSCGALDMVNFAARPTVPPAFRGRNLYVHNASVTLMRTTSEENARIGRWIGEKLNRCHGPVRFLLPEAGVSALDAPDMPFHDPAADAALFAAIEATVRPTDHRRVVRVPCHINDPAFAQAAAASFRQLL